MFMPSIIIVIQIVSFLWQIFFLASSIKAVILEICVLYIALEWKVKMKTRSKTKLWNDTFHRIHMTGHIGWLNNVEVLLLNKWQNIIVLDIKRKWQYLWYHEGNIEGHPNDNPGEEWLKAKQMKTTHLMDSVCRVKVLHNYVLLTWCAFYQP